MSPNLTAIYSACDDPAIAAAKVVKDKGKATIVMGYDGLPDAAKANQAGEMKAISPIPRKDGRPRRPRPPAKAVRGGPSSRSIQTGTKRATKDNAASLLNFQRPSGCAPRARDGPGRPARA